MTLDGSERQQYPKIILSQSRVAIDSGHPVYIPYDSANMKRVSGGKIDAESNRLTLTTDVFTSADIGATVIIEKAGIGGSTLTTTIQAFKNSKEVTLSEKASKNVSEVVVSGVLEVQICQSVETSPWNSDHRRWANDLDSRVHRLWHRY